MFGLTIAESLPLHYDVTIVARDMPGDADTLDWASPWCVMTLNWEAKRLTRVQGGRGVGRWNGSKSGGDRDPEGQLAVLLGTIRDLPGRVDSQSAHQFP